jgi:hypothetical protein
MLSEVVYGAGFVAVYSPVYLYRSTSTHKNFYASARPEIEGGHLFGK